MTFLKAELDNVLRDRGDLEEYVSKVSFEEEKVPTAKEALNGEKDQERIFDDLMDFVLNDGEHQFYILQGYAGTGKTYVLSKFVSCIKTKVALTAPTNKAVKVLQDNGELDGHNIEYATIHKMLALKVVWRAPKRKGEVPRQVLQRNLYATPTLNDYSLIIIDEASMINWEVFTLLQQELGDNLKVIFMGDPAQIPPINEGDSIPLDLTKRAKYGFRAGELKKIMRQAEGNTILKVAYSIRDKRFQDIDSLREYRKLKVEDPYVKFLFSETIFRLKVMTYFDTPAFKTDPNYCKVIAWTNKMVNYYNEIIRQRLFGTTSLSKVMKGEQMIADKPIIASSEICFNTSEEFEIVDYEIKKFEYHLPGVIQQSELDFGDDSAEGRGGKFILDYYRCKVKYYTSLQAKKNGDASYQSIDILHEKHEALFKKLIKNLVQIAKQEGAWSHYYSMQERFASVKYNYAITAHKAQGSTYQHVFLIEDDIDKNRKYVEKNRIKYTAATRPSQTLTILSRRNYS